MRTWKQYLCHDEWGGEKGGYGKPQGSEAGWQLFPVHEMKDKNSKLVKLGRKQEMQMQRQQGLGGSGGEPWGVRRSGRMRLTLDDKGRECASGCTALAQFSCERPG